MSELKVPYGLTSDGEVVCVSMADKGKHYACPCCNSKLTLREGKLRTKHFAHPTDAPCSQESLLHKTAKMVIEQTIHQHARREATINIHKPCDACGTAFTLPLPASAFSHAKQEVGAGGFICDVMAYQQDSAVLAIEICHTHEVDSHKGTTLPVKWIELDAEAVLEDPYHWHALQSGLKPSFCSPCKNHLQRVVKACDEAGFPRQLYTPMHDPAATYVADIEKCFRCHKETPVFWWKDTPFGKTPPPAPRPRTLSWRFSKTYKGAYWMNTCAHCGASQGDNFLHTMPDAVFSDMPHNNYKEAHIARKLSTVSPSATLAQHSTVFADAFLPDKKR